MRSACLKTPSPQHYDLSLTPDLKAAQFDGSAKIDLILARPANTITLNAAALSFESVTASVPGASPIAAAVMLAPGKEQAIFVFPVEFPAGTVRLAIEYSGTLNGDPRGFYLFRTDKRTYASSSFEGIHARRAFPSFDEPLLKATFDIALTVDADDMALFNSPVISDQPAARIDGVSKHTVRFGTTPKLSTYLVALLVGQFECISGTSDARLIHVCAMPGKAEAGRFSLMTAEAILHDYNRYLGIRFPLPKLDMIALPELKSAGLENFGAITYRETSLLIDKTSETLEQKKEVVVTVAHEIAHQWFGDLVTMEWWDNLWLNKGLAT